MRIFFLIGEQEAVPAASNLLLLGNAILRKGHELFLADIDSLGLDTDRLFVSSLGCRGPLQPGADLRAAPWTRRSLMDADIVWLLSLGNRNSFLDKMQLLALLAERVRLVNSVESLLHLKSKYALATAETGFKYPASLASSDWSLLWQKVLASDVPWIAKSPAGSFGRDVFLLQPSDANGRAILQTLTSQGRYALLQEYVPEAAEGEMRVLFAAGKLQGQYQRLPGPDHRANLEQGGKARAGQLSPSQLAKCQKLGTWLKKQGAWFCGVDMAGDWILECNVVNPGGLASIDALTGIDCSEAAVTDILAALDESSQD